MTPYKNAYHDACAMCMKRYPNLRKYISGLVNNVPTRVHRIDHEEQSVSISTQLNMFRGFDFNNTLNIFQYILIQYTEASIPDLRKPLRKLSAFHSANEMEWF